jgi:ribonuclease HII
VDIRSLSIRELTERFLDRSCPEAVFDELKADPRSGVRALVARIEERRRANRSEGQRLRHLLRFEEELWAEGHSHIGGVDEAGMGPLAGPVVAAAAILPRGFRPRGVNDSKQVDKEDRESLAAEIKASAIAWGVGVASVEEIDRINIYHAGLLAMRRAVLSMKVTPTYLLIDARKLKDLDIPQRGIIRGDALSMSIAAASIIAKTTRDAMLAELDRQYPGYGWAKNMGYSTPDHLAALDKLGATPVHRRSFAPVRKALGLEPIQAELFDARGAPDSGLEA